MVELIIFFGHWSGTSYKMGFDVEKYSDDNIVYPRVRKSIMISLMYV